MAVAGWGGTVLPVQRRAPRGGRLDGTGSRGESRRTAEEAQPMDAKAERVKELELLVAEALDHFTNEQSLVDIRDWVKSARASLKNAQAVSKT